ncbi:BRO-N domain-containing protein [Campylobacter fetus]|uniref:Bro-N domain-containing protein n=1 Tax=Campylobacter fetus TaxID=196 RepID=A0A7D7Q542_CAMFE|nr:BRO family protein [Campylobacter fetus]QMS69493.1 hypothetical protein GZ984_009405 [Campylobacter fetus]
MNEVVLFENKDFGNIRVLGNYLNPLFCLSDICKILNVKRVNSIRDMIDREFDKGGVFEYTPFQTRGGKQKFIMITEPELYFILMRSDKPKARPFRQWVINEVLPKIRQQGYYSSNQKVALQDRRLDLPDTPCRDIVEQQIKKIEMQENVEFVSLISYEIKEAFKDGKQSTIQKVHFNMRKRRDI